MAAVVLGVAHGVIYLVATWELQFPDRGLNLGPLHQEHGLSHWTSGEVPVLLILDLFFLFFCFFPIVLQLFSNS